MIKGRFLNFYIIAFLSTLQAEIILPTDDLGNWNVLLDEKIWVGWKHSEGFDWCRSKSIMKESIADIRKIIEDKENYPNIIKSIEVTKSITDEIVYIVVDMPFPFASRDYVVKYIKDQVGDEYIYSYYAVIHPDVPVNNNYVRLIHSSGEWRVRSLDSTHTEFTYTWNGELLGNFPNWALTRAWEVQGNEVLNWLKQSVQN